MPATGTNGRESSSVYHGREVGQREVWASEVEARTWIGDEVNETSSSRYTEGGRILVHTFSSWIS